MAFAETAKLSIDLSLTGNWKSQLAQAQSGFSKLASGPMQKTTSAVQKLGGAFNRLKGSIAAQVAGGILGANLLTSAVSGLENLFTSTIAKATAYGEAVAKVAAVTGDTAEATSQLVDTLDFFGVAAEDQTRIIGMAEKNLGELTKTQKSATDFTKEYGLKLEDASGHVLGFNDLLLQSADYFNNKSIPAQTKAAALAKVFGRNWQQLIPVFTQGSAKLQAMEADAISLTSEDLANMKDFKEASREWDDALGDLQITVGAKLLPSLTALAKTASAFVRDHSTDIVAFFKDASKAAGDFFGAAMSVGGAIKGVWDSIPPEFRDLLVKGLIADRTVKFLFGFSPLKFAADTIGPAIVKGLGSIIGKNIVQPVFVTNQVPGGGDGLPNILPEAAGAAGISGLSAGLLVALPIAIGATLGEFSRQFFAGMDSHIRQINLRTQTAQATGGKPQGFGMGGFPAANQGGGGQVDMESRRGQIGANLARDQLAKLTDLERGQESMSGKFTDDIAVLGKTTDAMKGRLSDDLVGVQNTTKIAGADTSRAATFAGIMGASATYAGASSIVSAIFAAQPKITINNSISATGVTKTNVVTSRNGPSGGDRDTLTGVSGHPMAGQ